MPTEPLPVKNNKIVFAFALALVSATAAAAPAAKPAAPSGKATSAPAEKTFTAAEKTAIADRYLTCAAKTSSLMQIYRQLSVHVDMSVSQQYRKLSGVYLRVAEAFSSRDWVTSEYPQKLKTIEAATIAAGQSRTVNIYMNELAAGVSDCANSSATEIQSLMPTVNAYFKNKEKL